MVAVAHTPFVMQRVGILGIIRLQEVPCDRLNVRNLRTRLFLSRQVQVKLPNRCENACYTTKFDQVKSVDIILILYRYNLLF